MCRRQAIVVLLNWSIAINQKLELRGSLQAHRIQSVARFSCLGLRHLLVNGTRLFLCSSSRDNRLLINVRLYNTLLLPCGFFSTLGPLLNSHLGDIDVNWFVVFLELCFLFFNFFYAAVLRINLLTLLLLFFFFNLIHVTPFLESFILKQTKVWVLFRFFHHLGFLFWAHLPILFQKFIPQVESITRLVKFFLLLLFSEFRFGFRWGSPFLRMFNTFSTQLVNWVVILIRWSFARLDLVNCKIWRHSTNSSCAPKICVVAISGVAPTCKRRPSVQSVDLLACKLDHIEVNFMLRPFHVSSILKFDKIIDFLHAEDPVWSVWTLTIKSVASSVFVHLLTTRVVVYPHRYEHTFCYVQLLLNNLFLIRNFLLLLRRISNLFCETCKEIRPRNPFSIRASVDGNIPLLLTSFFASSATNWHIVVIILLLFNRRLKCFVCFVLSISDCIKRLFLDTKHAAHKMLLDRKSIIFSYRNTIHVPV